jgi:hypothetical protein
MRIAPLSQGIFYVATGLWPIVHLRSFEAVTGRKRDKWLVQTVGGLIAAVGGALLVGAFESRGRRAGEAASGASERPSRSLRTLGITSAAVLASSDIYFVAKGRISPVYLGDAAVEAAMIAAWALW